MSDYPPTPCPTFQTSPSDQKESCAQQTSSHQARWVFVDAPGEAS